MLLAVDVGNTQTVFGLYDGPELGDRWRIATEAHRTGDELGALLGDFLDLGAIDGICLASTVPTFWIKMPATALPSSRKPFRMPADGSKAGRGSS